MTPSAYRMHAFLSLGITFVIIGIAFAITTHISWLVMALIGVALLITYHLRHRENHLGKRIGHIDRKRKP